MRTTDLALLLAVGISVAGYLLVALVNALLRWRDLIGPSDDDASPAGALLRIALFAWALPGIVLGPAVSALLPDVTPPDPLVAIAFMATIGIAVGALPLGLTLLGRVKTYESIVARLR